MLKRYPNLSRFTRYYSLQKGVVRRLICVMLLASSLGMLIPYIVSRRLLSIATPDFEIVLKLSAALMTIILFHHIFWYFWEKIGSVLTQNVALDIRRDIVSAFVDTRLSELRDRSSGFYLERLNDDVLEVAQLPANMLGVVADCLTNLSFLAIIYIISAPCGLIFSLGIALIFIINTVKIRVDLRYTELLKALNEQSASRVGENFAGIKDIKALGIKAQTVERTSDIYRETAQLQIEKDRKLALLSRCKTYTKHFIESLLIVYAVGALIPANRISVVALLTIVNYSGMMYDLVEYLANIRDWFVRGDFKASRILTVLSPDSREAFGETETVDKYDIRIRGLSYAYDDGTELLHEINLSIPENTTALFTGASGGGKSTLFHIIVKLLKCDDGKVFIGGTDVNRLSEAALRRAICMVTQEPFLLNDSVLENVRIVKPDATREDVIRACEKAHIHDEILAFGNGYDTIVAINGANLSGGQKQRLSIARALLKDCPIILFDEPTSHLDRANQCLFFETLRELKSQKTILLIAHQQTDEALFDFVYELVDGRLSPVSAGEQVGGTL